jgi:hypothetical protein
VLVGQHHAYLADLRNRADQRRADGEQHLLQRVGVGPGEGGQDGGLGRLEGRVPVEPARHLRRQVAPGGADRGGQDAVPGLRQRGVGVLGVPPELRRGGVHHRQVLQAGYHRYSGPLTRPGTLVDVHHGGPYQLAGAGERVAGRADRGPRVFVDRDPGAGDRPLRGHEERAELDRERLRRGVHAELPGQRVGLVLLRVGRQHVRVGAGQVRVGQVAGQRSPQVPVPDQVAAIRPGAAVDVHQPHLRLAVLVSAELDHWGLLVSQGRVSRLGSARRRARPGAAAAPSAGPRWRPAPRWPARARPG